MRCRNWKVRDKSISMMSRKSLLRSHLRIPAVPSILLERHNTRLGAPKAHALSPRSLEICRQFDISVSEIRRYPAPREEASHVRFVTTLAGEEIGSLPYERMSLDVLDASPEVCHPAWIHCLVNTETLLLRFAMPDAAQYRAARL